jgi:hypothetical protein
VSMTGKIEQVEVITSVQRRRRWSAEEKAAVVQKTYAPGMSVSLVRAGMVLRLIGCSVGGGSTSKGRCRRRARHSTFQKKDPTGAYSGKI